MARPVARRLVRIGTHFRRDLELHERLGHRLHRHAVRRKSTSPACLTVRRGTIRRHGVPVALGSKPSPTSRSPTPSDAVQELASTYC
jgi:hypothetical protein